MIKEIRIIETKVLNNNLDRKKPKKAVLSRNYLAFAIYSGHIYRTEL